MRQLLIFLAITFVIQTLAIGGGWRKIPVGSNDVMVNQAYQAAVGELLKNN